MSLVNLLTQTDAPSRPSAGDNSSASRAGNSTQDLGKSPFSSLLQDSLSPPDPKPASSAPSASAASSNSAADRSSSQNALRDLGGKGRGSSAQKSKLSDQNSPGGTNPAPASRDETPADPGPQAAQDAAAPPADTTDRPALETSAEDDAQSPDPAAALAAQQVAAPAQLVAALSNTAAAVAAQQAADQAAAAQKHSAALDGSAGSQAGVGALPPSLAVSLAASDAKASAAQAEKVATGDTTAPAAPLPAAAAPSPATAAGPPAAPQTDVATAATPQPPSAPADSPHAKATPANDANDKSDTASLALPETVVGKPGDVARGVKNAVPAPVAEEQIAPQPSPPPAPEAQTPPAPVAATPAAAEKSTDTNSSKTGTPATGHPSSRDAADPTVATAASASGPAAAPTSKAPVSPLALKPNAETSAHASTVKQAADPEASDAPDARIATEPAVGPAQTQTPLHDTSRVAHQTAEVANVNPAQIVEHVAQGIQSAHQNGQHVRLQLHPSDLGAMQIDISVKDGTLSARLETQTTAAQQILTDHLPQLKDALAQQGMTVDRFEIHVVDPQPTDGGAASGSQTFARDQQSSRDQAGYQGPGFLQDEPNIVDKQVVPPPTSTRPRPSLSGLDIKV